MGFLKRWKMKMKPEDRLVGFPYFSFYTKNFKEMFESLGLKVIEPIKINEETVKLGVKHSAEMICFPYKIVLGNFIQQLEKGANTLIMFNSCGKCKLRHYYKLIDLKLHELGYDFEMISLPPEESIKFPMPYVLERSISFIKKLSELSSKGKVEVIKVVKKTWKDIREKEKREYAKEFGEINILITGEIFSALEPNINQNIKQQLEKLGATIHSSLSILGVITAPIHRTKEKKILRQKALSYLDKVEPGGHGLHTIEDVLEWSEKGIDGIIFVMPLTCHPEILVEDIIDHLCKKNKVPLLKVKLDETASPLNIQTRIETFYELIKRRKERS